MRLLLYVVFILLFASCKSVEKLVDKGSYDEAIQLAVKRLIGKSKKKKKDIILLERALARANKNDELRIAHLKQGDHASGWDEIYHTALKIQKRQGLIEPLIPLYSHDGYLATFDVLPAEEILNESAHRSSELHYEAGQQYLEKSILTREKYLARAAYHEFESVRRYFDTFEALDSLMDKSYEYGRVRVLFRISEPVPGNLIWRTFEEAGDTFDRFWVSFQTEGKASVNDDFRVDLQMGRLEISPEREWLDQFQRSAEIPALEELVDSTGVALTDSSGNILSRRVMREITADIRQIIRSKEARWLAELKITASHTNEILHVEIIESSHLFESNTCSYSGDERALSRDIIQKTRNMLLPFPSDDEMASILAAQIFELTGQVLSRNYFL